MTLEELGGALYAAAQSCGEWFADGLDNVFAGNFGQLTIGQAALALLAILAVAISLLAILAVAISMSSRIARKPFHIRWAEAEAERLRSEVFSASERSRAEAEAEAEKGLVTNLRAAIESGLRDGQVRVLVATIAVLSLGLIWLIFSA